MPTPSSNPLPPERGLKRRCLRFMALGFEQTGASTGELFIIAVILLTLFLGWLLWHARV